MRLNCQERLEFASQEIFMNQWGKLLLSGIDAFDAAAGWRRSADLRGVR